MIYSQGELPMQTITRPANPFPPLRGVVNVAWVIAGHSRTEEAGQAVNLPTVVPMKDKKGRG